MKYGYDGAKSSDIIDNYRKGDSEIIITFLDGSIKTVPLNNTYETRIKNLMLKQAEDRNNSDEAKVENHYKNFFNFTSSGMSVASALFIIAVLSSRTYDSKSAFYNALIAFVISVTGVGVYISDKEVKLSKEEINDIKKYSIYLASREKLENYKNNLKLYRGIEYRGELDINTLDYYSLSDMLKIEKNLLKLEKTKSHDDSKLDDLERKYGI